MWWWWNVCGALLLSFPLLNVLLLLLLVVVVVAIDLSPSSLAPGRVLVLDNGDDDIGQRLTNERNECVSVCVCVYHSAGRPFLLHCT